MATVTLNVNGTSLQKYNLDGHNGLAYCIELDGTFVDGNSYKCDNANFNIEGSAIITKFNGLAESPFEIARLTKHYFKKSDNTDSVLSVIRYNTTAIRFNYDNVDVAGFSSNQTQSAFIIVLYKDNDGNFAFPMFYDIYNTETLERASNDAFGYVVGQDFRLLTIDSSYSSSKNTELKAVFTPWVDPTPEDPYDPYDPSGDGSGYSGTGGGPAPTGGTGTTGNGGLHDDTSDAIPTPSLPTDVVTGSGLFTAYNPSASQLASFANALWNMQPTDINDVLRFLFGGDAFNAIIGLHLLPVAPSTGGSPSIKLGNWDTGVSAPKINNQYKQVSFGSVLLPEYWGNCIDYAPYTKIQLALPYIGIVDVDTDDVLGSTNTLAYNIDVLSGAICATLHCVKGNLNSVIYQWSGACAVSLPFSGASYNSVLGSIAGVAAAGMGFAAMAAGPIGAALPAAALGVGAGAFSAGSAASIMGSMKGKVQKSGSFGANSGALGIMTPYFILTRPVQSVPETWQADKGYPANVSAQLGMVTGYTEVSEINLECSGTEAEKNEIIDLLKKGVLF